MPSPTQTPTRYSTYPRAFSAAHRPTKWAVHLRATSTAVAVCEDRDTAERIAILLSAFSSVDTASLRELGDAVAREPPPRQAGEGTGHGAVLTD